MIVKTKSARKTTVRKKSPPSRNGHKNTNGRRNMRPDFTGPRDEELETVLIAVTAQPETKRLDEWISVPCPYCGEEFEVHATSDQDGQTVSDRCQVCCRPVSLHILVEDEELQVEAQRS